ncbi:MAG: tetratricopeptide repeat protein [Hyphomicrobiales bacterium]
MNIAPELGRALRSHQEGKFVEAEQICLSILESTPDHFDAMHLLAFMKSQKGQLEEAQHLLASALRHNPRSAEAWLNLGTVLIALKRPAEALASFDRGIALRPDNADAHDHRGRLLVELKRHEEAVASFDRAIASRPGFAGTHNNRGVALRNLGRAEEALQSFDRAAALKPDNAGVHNNRGNALRDLKRPVKALENFDRALALKPDLVEAHNNRGFALCDLKRHDEALGSFDRAIALKPGYVEAINGRGIALFELKRPDEALESFGRALALQPGYAEAHVSRGNALIELRRPGEALESYKRAFSLNPDHPFAFGLLANAALHCCDWATARQVAQDLDARIDDGRSIVPPFALLGYPASALTQLKCARNFSRYKIPYRLAPLWRGESYRHEKIRLAYLSADFHSHATAYLTTELFELHDRSRFEVRGIAYGPDDRSDARGRLVKAFDQFHDARGMDDRSVASLLREAEVDIAVNLTGYTQNSRPEIFAHRPAPVQASFLGYPGTMGGDFIDYLIADPIVLPFDQQPYYPDKIVHLPDCYQANDRKRAIATATSSRKAEGLPDRGFVFCCFNNSWKIAEPIFDIWMDLLRGVEGSVLWLLRDNDNAVESLRGAALARGVDPARIVFAGRIAHAEHLARHRLADLFLDTLPYNAHATASDALWAGLPLLTSTGSTFASRVATSLLHAAGLPQLVTTSLEEYRGLALTLATDSARIQSVRRGLERNRGACPLFDTDRFQRHIEAAFAMMSEISRSGEEPRQFSVESG